MHRVLSLGCFIAAAMLVVAGGWMNFRFLSAQAHLPSDASVLGMTSIAADIMKATLPPLIAFAWVSRQRLIAGISALTFVVLAVFAFASAVGFSAERRNQVVDTRHGASARHEMLTKQLAAIEARAAKLGEQRASAVIASEIAHPRLQAADCTRTSITRLCQRRAELDAELTRAKVAEDLQREIAHMQSEIIASRSAGALVEAEGQGAAIARLLGLTKEQANDLTLFWIALVVELGSGFGFLIALSGNPLRVAEKAPPADEASHIEAAKPLVRPDPPEEITESQSEPLPLRPLLKRRTSVLHDPPPS